MKKAFYIALAAIGIVAIFGANSGSTPTQASVAPVSAPYVNPAPAPKIQAPAPKPSAYVPPAPMYAPNGTYTNVDGNEVPSPYYAPSAPAGASAQCSDGTYSFSQHRQGTCSHHGGVAMWL